MNQEYFKVHKTKYKELIKDLTHQLSRRNINPKNLGNDLLLPFDQFTDQEIIQHLELLEKIINQYEILDPLESKSNQLRSIILHHGLVPIDTSLFDRIEEEDLIEIIDLNTLTPLYRCMDSFGVTNYSIEELLSYSPLVLFDRPSWVTTEILKVAEDIKNEPRIIKMNHFPTYIMQETLSLKGDQYLITHKYMGPLVKMGDSRPSSVVSTFTIQKCNEDDSGDIRII
ncbi:MAG: hypothetical protein CME60_06680 [Halobacteriovoraceae bacterium]|jgi:hypothetical protein|nr:hypothetical protein [Halobacteriovoraceae bacterium]